MPIKYIKIKHLHARVPFRECLIQFVIRKKESHPITHSQIEFYAKSISYTVDQNIELTYSTKQSNTLAIYLMAINGSERVACIGFVPLNLNEVFMDRKDKLEEMNEQSGYIIYSMQNEPFTDMNHMINVKMSSSSLSSEEGVKNQLEKLCVQRSNFKVEDQEKAKEDKVEKNQPSPIAFDKTLTRTRKDICLQRQPNLPTKQVVSDNFSSKKKEKSDLNPTYSAKQLKNGHSKTEISSTQYEQLQSFYIEVLKHKIQNTEYFRMIKENDEYLQRHIRDLV